MTQDVSRPEKYLRIVDLGMKIQRAGHGTVCVSVDGHCDLLSFQAFIPEWKSNMDPSYRFFIFPSSSDEEVIGIIDELMGVLTSGFSDKMLDRYRQEVARDTALLESFSAKTTQPESPALEAECGIAHPSDVI